MKVDSNLPIDIKRKIKFAIQEHPDCKNIYMDVKTYKINNYKPNGVTLHYVNCYDRFILAGK